MTDCRTIVNEVDSMLRVVAPSECPTFSSRLAVTFAEIGVASFVKPTIYGLTANGLDRHAAAVLADDSLIGRPVFAIDTKTIVELNRSVDVIPFARDIGMHELAHAVDRKSVEVVTDDYAALVTSSVTGPTFNVTDPTCHDRRWWRRYITLVARLDTIASRLTPWRDVGRAAAAYGYSAVTASRWVAAAKTVPGYLDGSILDVSAMHCPEFDRLLDHVSKTTAAAPAEADTPS